MGRERSLRHDRSERRPGRALACVPSAVRFAMGCVVLCAGGLVGGCSDTEVQGKLATGAGGTLAFDNGGSLTDGVAAPSDTNATPDAAMSPGTIDMAGWSEPDVPPAPGTFGAPCESAELCDSGVCVEGANGKYCTKTCSGMCPSNHYKCQEWTAPSGDVSFICLPRFKTLCFPCQEHKECNAEGESGNLCLAYGLEGSFCGVKCDPLNPLCPPGYGCSSVVDDATGLKSNQCLRSGAGGSGLQLCECALKSIEQGLKTKCAVQAIVYDKKATCWGTRLCKADGLTACSANVPIAEKCDGFDNDCNGKVDDFEEKNLECFSKPNEFGKCKGLVLDCVEGKETCSAVPAKPEACNGVDDDCDGTTDEGLCEDGDPCTNDVCNTDGSCKHVQLAGMLCDDGSICTQTDKCLAGKCVGGNVLPCDDQDTCTADSCDPFTGCVHKPASDAVCKDDGNPCTLDQCQQGQCVHPPASGKPCTDEGEACTQDTCEQGACSHPPVKEGTPCQDDGKPCTVDVCTAGKCAHPNGDGQKCQDDGKACTDDVCQGGGCFHPFNTTPCEDGNFCTESDQCSGGTCKPGAPKNCNDSNPCTNDACNTKTGCVKTNNDFASCTAGATECPLGQCSGGNCFSKANVTCQTKISADLCGKIDVAGLCTSSGKCVVSKPPPQYTCPGCNGLCVKCFGIQLCLPLFGP
ncbi:MAG: hypothetical protein EXR79_03950 [Myxococcales bacterium]|nr:hypothetical protein [Myxococcales bacterium]